MFTCDLVATEDARCKLAKYLDIINMKFLTLAFIVNFLVTLWPKTDVISEKLVLRNIAQQHGIVESVQITGIAQYCAKLVIA